MLVGLTIRIEREIYGIAERFLDILSGSDSILFVGAPNVGKTALLRDVCNFLAERVWPKLLSLLDSTQELGGGGAVPHKCLGRTRVFGGRFGKWGVRLVATTHGSFQDLLLHKDKSTLLGGVNQVVITDETAKEKAIFSKIRLQRKQIPMFETVDEVLGKAEYRIIRDVQTNVDLALSGSAIRAEGRFIDANGILFAEFEEVTVDIVA
ncbi:hypothetical protein HDU87_000655 [Geranomyces variabilis]|uniref:AAA+ ATPase domain-containing protein n=1 Tax=Geranomyces variabilis TaxID=109894 RepID=A0AAD5TDM6_9FUNG|nr:hypothetical protein HDU87_000655 [Geranomyces variabilis]